MEINRVEIFEASQGVVMLSGKALQRGKGQICRTRCEERDLRVFNNEYVLLLPKSQQYATLYELLLACLAKAVRITCGRKQINCHPFPSSKFLNYSPNRSPKHTTTQAQYLDMIAQPLLRQCQHRRRKEHGLIIRMGDQQADPLIPELRKARLLNMNGVEPTSCKYERNREEIYPLHC